jgi:hypothetical protein
MEDLIISPDKKPILSKEDFLHLIPEIPAAEIVRQESGYEGFSQSRQVLVRSGKPFKWNKKTEKAAMALAHGYTVMEAAEMANTTDRTIRRWKNHPEFAEEVDYLSHMVGVANRAERLRIVQRVVRAIATSRPELLITEKDLLDWLKYAQSETDGVKLDLATIAEAAESLAGS